MNKYLITAFLFGIWILFIHEYNLFFFKKKVKEKNQLESQKDFYKKEIKKDSLEIYKIEKKNLQEKNF